VEAWGTTAGIVKLLLPPRQSRGNSHDIRNPECTGAEILSNDALMISGKKSD
jgi:hypothetical protein